MAIIKCKMCGGDIELAPDKTFGTCEYCGSTMTLPKIDDEQRAAAFNRGNHFRRIGEFDKALSVYERIVQEDENDAEAHWCCALCRFGIEYVEDPATYEWLPTCHRLSFDSFLEDVDYLAALEHSDGITRRQYQKDGAKIAEVQRGILATSQNTEPYDVFICYKETDENNQRTRDSILAQDIYYQLTEQGRRVFFARITLEDVPGAEYEPYIFAALNSAKVMVVVGTSGENLSAVWVKNEWSRFLALMKKDRSKLLIPCFRDMDPYDLPEQLSVLQSYDMGKIGFIQDLLRGVGKVLDAGKKPEVKETVVVQQQGGTNVEALLKRGQMALEDGDWAKADGFFEEVLNQNAENARAYIGKALAAEQQPSLDMLAQAHLDRTQNADETIDLTIPADEIRIAEAVKLAVPGYYEREEIQKAYLSFDRSYPSQVRGKENLRRKLEAWWREHKQLSRAAKFAQGEDKAELENAINRVQEEMADRIRKAQEKENAAEADVKGQYAAFLKKMDAEVREKAARALEQREHDYKYYKAAIETGGIDQLRSAVTFLQKMSGYKDSNALVKQAQEKIDAIEAEESRIRAEKEVEAAKRRAEEKEKAKKKTIMICSISAITIVAVIAAILVLTKVVIPSQKYKNAEALMAAGDYGEAITAFEALGDYKDSAEQAESAQIAKAEADEAAKAAEIEAANAESYKEAETLLADGDKAHAAMAFGALGSYSDAKERSFALWNEITDGNIFAGIRHAVGVNADGTVVATGSNDYGMCEVSSWTNIVAVSAGYTNTIGLRSNGKVISTKYVGDSSNNVGQNNVDDWKDIIAVSAGWFHTVGLRANGKVVATKFLGEEKNYGGQCEVSGWTDIVAISAGRFNTVGLKSDGTVVAVGPNYYGECDVDDWTDIVAISAGEYHTVGLKSDGTVVATKYRGDKFTYDGQCEVSDWTDIVAVSAGEAHTVGLKADGTVVITEYLGSYYRNCDVSGWRDIVAVSAGNGYVIGLKSDGTVVAVGKNDDGRCDVSGWTEIKLP